MTPFCCFSLVHSTGADLQAAAGNVGNSLPGGARGYLGYVTTHINSPQILPFLEAAVEARAEIAHAVVGNRDLLYLDVALENSIRSAAERGVGSAGFGAVALMGPLLQNLCLSKGDNEEACFCLKVCLGGSAICTRLSLNVHKIRGRPRCSCDVCSRTLDSQQTFIGLPEPKCCLNFAQLADSCCICRAKPLQAVDNDSLGVK